VDSEAPSVELSGVPSVKTSSTDLRATVGGLGVVAYKYALDNDSPVWSAIDERPVTSPILHSGLSRTDHTLRVIGRDTAGNWQAIARICTWNITPLVPPAVNDGGEGINYDTDLLVAFTWTLPDDTADVRIQVATDVNFANILFDSVIGIVSRYDYLVTESNGPAIMPG
jgi:hypothetical protein